MPDKAIQKERNFDFRTCPRCNGYGVLDNGRNCRGCGAHFPIAKAKFIQTHFYIEPHGCTGGDYWKQGEGQIVTTRSNSRRSPRQRQAPPSGSASRDRPPQGR